MRTDDDDDEDDDDFSLPDPCPARLAVPLLLPLTINDACCWERGEEEEVE